MKRWLWLCLFLQCCLLPLVWPLYVVGDFNDDASYLGLARSLAQGLPYQDLFEMGAPARSRFPPGYPLCLAPLQWLSPQNFLLPRLQAVLFSLAALALFVRTSLRLELKAAALLLAANPFWAFSGSTIMSEGLFTAALLLYLDFMPTRRGPRQLFVLGLAASLCYYVRAVGLVLIPTTLWWRRRQPWTEHMYFLIGCALGAGPHALGNLVTGYDGEFAKQHAALWQIWLENLKFIPLHYGAVMLGHPRLLLGPLYCLVFGLGLAGLWRLRARTPVACFTFCYLALMLNWPFYLPRFALPVLPFLYLGLAALFRKPLALILVAELGSALAPRPANRECPAEQIQALVSKIPPGRRVAASGMDFGVYAGLASYGQDSSDLTVREWSWEQGLLDHQVGLVVLLGDYLKDLKLRFLERPARYRLVYETSEYCAFSYSPTPSQRRASLLHSVARTALQQRRFTTAEALFRRALQYDPDLASLHSGLAFCLAQQERLPEAIEQARRAVRLDPHNQEASRLTAFFGD